MVEWFSCRHRRIFLAYLGAYALFSALTLAFYPSYGWPAGDEATYYSYAMRPWSLTSDFFEGFPPKEVINPFNFRLFLTPFSLLFATLGFTYLGARLIVLGYGLSLLAITYSLARRLAPPWLALSTVVVLSLSPIFIFSTHGVRPEGMMTLWLMFTVWIVARHEPPISARAYFLAGLVAASTLWIHYHGIVAFPLLLVATVVYDRTHVTRHKLGAFLGGGLVFAACFLVLNLLPAWTTIKTYGLLPVTYASSNRVPILSPGQLPESLKRSFDYYAGVIRGNGDLGPWSGWFTLVMALPAVFGAWRPATRLASMLVALLLMLLVAYALIFPNARWQYLLYLYPVVFLLAARGLANLPPGRDMTVLAVILLTLVGGAYAYDSGTTLKRSWEVHGQNEQVGAVLQTQVERLGDPRRVVVMGAQEFHRFVPRTRFRTFHSLITLRDFNAVLKRFKPDVVLINQRGVMAITTFLNERLVVNGIVNLPPELGHRWIREGLLRRDPRSGRWMLNKNRVEPVVRTTLAKQGYRRLDPGEPLRWDGGRVEIYVREKDRSQRVAVGRP